MGGAAGHIKHPHENLNLTFRDLYDLVEFITIGKYREDEDYISYLNATEKLDGQQLSVSWINDRGLVVARNKGHVKKFGQDSLGREELAAKFNEHICFDAFLNAYDSLDSVMLDLTYEQKHLIFENGGKWMSLEVIYPDTTNVIDYNKKLIFFHYTSRYDVTGKFLGLYHGDADKLFKMLPIKKYGHYTFKAPIVIKTADISRLNIRFFNQIRDIYDTYDLNYLNTIGEYLEAHFSRILDRRLNFTDNTIKDKILRRFVYGDKSFTLTQAKQIEGLAEWIKKYEKEELLFELKYARRPLEKCFLELGTLLFHHTDNKQFLIKGNKKSTNIIVDRLREALEVVPITDQKLNHQIYLLEEIGLAVPDHIQATEGIVFHFKDEMYKLTGCFAPINQILGELRF